MDYDKIFHELGLKPFTENGFLRHADWQNEFRRTAYDEVMEHEVIYRSTVSDNIEIVYEDDSIDPALVVSKDNEGNIHIFNGHHTYEFKGEYTLRVREETND